MVDVQTIQKLRQQTGAGMVDCKKALTEADGDFDNAVDILRKKGEAKAAKKADRAVNEGLMAVAQSDDKIAIVGLACETDFVARNEDFIQAVKDYSQKLLTMPVEEFKSWAEENIKTELVVKIGENIQLKIAKVFDAANVGYYLHANNKVAAVVELSKPNKELAIELAMQVVAMSPDYVKPEDVSADELEKEKEVYREQLKNEGKPEDIIEKILQGKVNKYYEEVCLLKQDFIKEDKKKVEDYIKEKDPEIQVIKFEKIEL